MDNYAWRISARRLKFLCITLPGKSFALKAHVRHVVERTDSYVRTIAHAFDEVNKGAFLAWGSIKPGLPSWRWLEVSTLTHDLRGAAVFLIYQLWWWKQVGILEHVKLCFLTTLESYNSELDIEEERCKVNKQRCFPSALGLILYIGQHCSDIQFPTKIRATYAAPPLHQGASCW